MKIIQKFKKLFVLVLSVLLLSSLFVIGGPLTIAKASTTDTQLVYMQNIYHDENDNVNVLFNVCIV